MAHTYGTHEQSKAVALALRLKEQHPENRYHIEKHDPARGTWGVIRYTPYLDAMPTRSVVLPYRCEGFVWHNYDAEGGEL